MDITLSGHFKGAITEWDMADAVLTYIEGNPHYDIMQIEKNLGTHVEKIVEMALGLGHKSFGEILFCASEKRFLFTNGHRLYSKECVQQAYLLGVQQCETQFDLDNIIAMCQMKVAFQILESKEQS
ncbi:hypothetical protein N9R79_07850 [Vibrio sp.]|nr:hypothetical protein [Vibrio sp.]